MTKRKKAEKKVANTGKYKNKTLEGKSFKKPKKNQISVIKHVAGYDRAKPGKTNKTESVGSGRRRVIRNKK